MPNPAKTIIKSLKSKTFCQSLAVRPDPYFEENYLDPGLYLGLRVGIKGAKWVARQRLEGNTQKTVTLGAYGDMTYDEAKEAARTTGEEKRSGIGLSTVKTVADAVKAYIKEREAAVVRISHEDLDNETDEYVRGLKVKSAKKCLRCDSLALTRTVLNNAIGEMLIKDVTDKVLIAWRDSLTVTPTKVKGEDKTLSNNSRDRYLKMFRAVLNYSVLAYDTVSANQRMKWNAVKRIGKDKAREGTLNKEQRFALANACDGDIRPLMYVLAQLPVRPNALAALRVKNLRCIDGKGILFVYDIKIDKFRWVALTDHLYAYMMEQAKGKEPDDLLFCTSLGNMWNNTSWSRRVAKAREKAGLPDHAVTYLMRHGVLSDMILNGTDALTTAQMGGTSMAQIDKHYGKMDMDIARGHLENLAPV